MLYPRVYKVTDVDDPKDWGHTDETSGLLVKPLAQPCKHTKLIHQECFLVDDSEYMYLVVGSQADSVFLEQVFGVSSTTELRTVEGYQAFLPVESDAATLLTNFIE